MRGLFRLCAALIGAPLGEATSLVREMVQHTSAATHTLSDILSLPSSKYYTSYPQALVLCHTGKVKTDRQTHTHTHRFQISLSILRGSYCFTGNRVTGQMIELLMEARCNNNRPLSRVIPT